jgi:hypothetical protein
MTDNRYPIGEANAKSHLTPDERQSLITSLAELPARLRHATRGLTDAQLDTPYRAGGWTVRAVVHHVPDSHLNAYIRVKLALTENSPVIKPYDENAWSELADAKTLHIEPSLVLLESVHERWVYLLRSLKPEDFAKTFQHPESGLNTIDRVVSLYAWHGLHHTAHITTLRERMGWK